ncbi:hypothetical protein DJ568_08910 [Mucilaginibacter hurinus]|uniref:IPT/TIG domain-containing protein n=1 Tax=Mucilaginibacter hurinus TaxID=2201324 RepID=A0A367GRF6_9SPHI|nr:FG-GAP-like repeat-containing protein [Mucilaginibacter hurinus]RCH55293.1 hypothetical protein DJ568_08910 [Mucilaginibacter hurinus]
MKRILLILLTSIFIGKSFGQAPVITSFSPTSGNIGAVVTIAGSNFNPSGTDNAVLFGGVKAEVLTASATQLTVKVPAGAVYNPISVVNITNKLSGYSSASFSVTSAVPVPIGQNVDFDPEVYLHFNGYGYYNYGRTAVADFDGDGKSDVLVSGGDEYGLAIYHRKAAGVSKESFTKISFFKDHYLVSVTDINGDGRPDIITSNRNSKIAVLINSSIPGTINSASFTSIVLNIPASIIFHVADVDVDGRPDFVTSNGQNTISIWRNKSVMGNILPGSFDDKVDVQINKNTEGQNMLVSISDLNSDGKPDIVVSNYNRKTTFYRNVSSQGLINTSSFTPAVELMPTYFPSSQTLADINGDGKPELLTTYYRDGTYKFSIFQNTSVDANAISFGPNIGYSDGAGVTSIAAKDMDGDGKPELICESLVTVNEKRQIYILRNEVVGGTITTSSFLKRQTNYINPSSVGISFCDIDGDGYTDMVTGQKSIAINRNNPMALPIIKSLTPYSTNSIGLKLGIDGENFSAERANNEVRFGTIKAPVVTSTRKNITVTIPSGASYEYITVLNKDKNLTVSSAAPFAPKYASNYEINEFDFVENFNLPSGNTPVATAIGDLNGDNKPDLVVVNKNDNNVYAYTNVTVKPGLTEASFSTVMKYATGDGPVSVVIKDINNDGKPEIITVNGTANTVSVLHNLSPGSGAFATSFSPKVDFATGLNPVKLIPVDVTVDGKPDLAVVNSGDNTFSILRNTSNIVNITATSFADKADFASGKSPSSIIASDVNHDGKVDVIVTNSGDNTFSVHLNNVAQGTDIKPSFIEKFVADAGLNPSDIAVGAYAGGQSPYYVVTNKGNNTVTVFDMSVVNNVIQVENKLEYVTGNAPVEVKLGDIDGDGTLDIATLNATAKTISVFKGKPGYLSLSYPSRIDLPLSATAGLNVCDLDNDYKPDMIVIKNMNENAITVVRNNRIQQPVFISSFSPQAAIAGTEITINGEGFNDVKDYNAVYFGTVKAEVIQSSKSKLIVKVPLGAAHGPISVSNTTKNRVSVSNQPFSPTFINRGNITPLEFEKKFELMQVGYGVATNVGDFNGDGKIDIVADSHFFRNVAEKGNLCIASFVKKGIAINSSNMAMDINGDGMLDLVQLSNGNLTYNLNTSTPGAEVPSFTEMKSSVRALKLVDIDNDGKIDAVSINDKNEIVVSRNVSASATEVEFSNPIVVATVGQLAVLDVTDIDGDNKTDIVVAYTNSGTITVFRNISEVGSVPALASKISFDTRLPGTRAIYFNDLDNDGKSELIVMHSGSKKFTVFRNIYGSSTAGYFLPGVSFNLDNTSPYEYVSTLHFNDMNGDGKTDIISSVYAYYGTSLDTIRGITIYKNNITGNIININSFAKQTKLNAGLLKNDLKIADFDADGRPDILLGDSRGLGVIQNNPFMAPVIKNVSPKAGNVGADVIITGKGFSSAASKNIVRFGAVKAEVTGVTDTTLRVVVPIGGTFEPITVLNAEKGRVASSSSEFISGVLTDWFLDKNSFSTKITAPTGNQPGGSAISDLDGDGKPDIVVVNRASNTVSIFQNTYKGGTRTDLKTGINPSGVGVADLDNDGKPDIVVANEGSNTISVFRNTSTGPAITSSSFAAKIDFTTGEKPVALVLADIDRDGKIDILSANAGAAGFSVIHNAIDEPGSISANSFKPKVDFFTGGNPATIAVADIDGDNAPDVITGNSNSNNLSILRNKALKGAINDKTFASRVDFNSSGSIVHIATADINGDGKPDILAATKAQNTFSYYQSNAVKDTVTSYTFNGYNIYNLKAQPSCIGVSDFNGDGKPDVIVMNSTNDSLSVYNNYNNYISAPAIYFAGKSPVSAVFGDVTGDGKPDIVSVSGESNSVSVLENGLVNSAPVITAVAPSSGAPGTVVTISGKNFDEILQNNVVYFGATRATVLSGFPGLLKVSVPDGATYQPISITNKYKGLSAYASTAFNTTYLSKAPLVDSKFDIATGRNPVGVVFSDVNSDGKPDILVSSGAENSIYIYQNNITGKGAFKSGSFGPPVKVNTGTAPASMALADFDGNGVTDMVVANYNNSSISVYTRATEGSLFSGRVDYTVGKNPSSVVVTDLNSDGKPDIVVSNSGSSSLTVLRNIVSKGKLSFVTATVQTGTNPSSVAVADINADGKPDILSANFAGNSVSVIQNRTAAASQVLSFAGKIDLPAGKNPQSIAVGDVNGDGKPDIVTANKGSGNVSVITNKHASGNITSGAFNTKRDFATSGSPIFVTLNDFSGDGKVDVLVANSASQNISVLINTVSGESVTFKKSDIPVGNGPQSLMAGDLDDDGKPDVAVANFGSNTISLIHNAATMHPAPVISSFTPQSGAVDELITINGSNFNTQADKNQIVFGAVSVIPQSATTSKLTVKVPSGATQQLFGVLDLSTGLAGKSTAPFIIKHKGKSILSQIDFKRVVYTSQWNNYSDSKVADLDGDGKSDIIAIDYSNIHIQRNTTTDSAGINFVQTYFQAGSYGLRSIMIEDMDGDGKPDLLFLSNNGTQLSVMRNIADSGGITQYSFDPRVDFQLPGEATELSIGDVDADGKPDVGISYRVNYSNEIFSVYRNISVPGSFHTGSLEKGVETITGSTNMRLVGDMDTDKKPDVIGFNPDYANRGVMMYKNAMDKQITSNGFELSAQQAMTNPNRFALADIDGDGRNDLVTLTGNNTLSVFRNNNTGTANLNYDAAVQIPLTMSWSGISFGDINGDAKTDIILSGYYNSGVGFILNVNTAGAVQSNKFLPMVHYTNVVSSGVGVSVADLDNDGKPDIVTDAGSILRNDPDFDLPAITFVTPLSGKAGTTVTISGTNFNTTPSANIVYFGSVPAKVLSSTSNLLTVKAPPGATYRPVSVQNLSKGLAAYYQRYFNLTFDSDQLNFKPRATVATSGKPYAMCIFDADVDSKPDMIVASPGANKILVFHNKAVSGEIAASSFSKAIEITAAGGPVAIAAGDLDGDGKPELVVANSTDKTIGVYGNSSSPGSIDNTSFSHKFNIPLLNSPLDIKLADFDGDGKLDIYFNDQSNGYYASSVYLNRFTGALAANSFIRSSISTYGSRQANWIADLNVDGKPDFVTIDNSGRLYVIQNNFVNGAYYNQANGNAFNAGVEPQSISAGDLDGDGKPELIVANKGSNTVSVLRNTVYSNNINYEAFAAKVDISTLANPKQVSVGDVNGDGKPDIVVTFFGTSKIMVYYNAATRGNITSGSFTQKKELDGGNDADNINIGDIDGDGRADLAVTNLESHTISIIQNLNTGNLTPSSVTPEQPVSELAKELTIYPNPATAYSNVQYNLPSQSDVEVEVFDKNGKQVRAYQVKSQGAGINRVKINTDGLATGIYLINVKALDFNKTGKLIIQ